LKHSLRVYNKDESKVSDTTTRRI